MADTNNPEKKHLESPHRSRDAGLLFAVVLFILSLCLLFFHWYKDDNRAVRLPTNHLHVPPELMTYQQISVFTCPIAGEPTCFAVWENRFIIGTDEPPVLWFFDENGTLLQKIDLPEEPRAIACGTPETIFTDKIVVAHLHQIAVYTADGILDTSWSLPDEASNIRSLALTPTSLFTADTGQRCIHRFNVDGNLDLTFGDFIVYASPMMMTYSFKDDLLYIANPGMHRVEVFTQDGESQPERSWGTPSIDYEGFAGCCNPIGLAVLDDGRILTVEKGISRVKIFRTGGALDCFVAGSSILDALPPGAMRRAPLKPDRYFAAVVLSEGHIAVFDFEYAAVRIFAPIP